MHALPPMKESIMPQLGRLMASRTSARRIA